MSQSHSLNKIYSKIATQNSISKQLDEWLKEKNKIVFTNGCFDIIHRGHIDYLAKASDLGNKLIIGVNSDASVKLQNKGISRPLQDEQTRAIILASFEFVDAVIIFDDETPLKLIQLIQPSILVKGADYDAKETNKTNKKYIVGSEETLQNGGTVKTIEFLDGFSTSKIEAKIKNSL